MPIKKTFRKWGQRLQSTLRPARKVARAAKQAAPIAAATAAAQQAVTEVRATTSLSSAARGTGYGPNRGKECIMAQLRNGHLPPGMSQEEASIIMGSRFASHE